MNATVGPSAEWSKLVLRRLKLAVMAACSVRLSSGNVLAKVTLLKKSFMRLLANPITPSRKIFRDDRFQWVHLDILRLHAGMPQTYQCNDRAGNSAWGATRCWRWQPNVRGGFGWSNYETL